MSPPAPTSGITAASADRQKLSKARETRTAHIRTRFAAPYLSAIFCLILGLFWAYQNGSGYDPGAKNASAILWVQGALDRDAVFNHGSLWRIFSAPLLHGSTIHIVSNCIGLLAIGVLMERTIGRFWFATIFFLGMIGGSVASLIGHSHAISVGASGAVFAVGTFGYCLFMGSNEYKGGSNIFFVYLLFVVTPIVTGFYDPSVDWAAHLGGAATGLLIFMALERHWDEKSLFPPFIRRAKTIACGGFISLVITFGICAIKLSPNMRVIAEAAGKPEEIPPAIFPRTADQGSRMSDHLIDAFPNDPYSHYYRAYALLVGENNYPAAATEMYSALAIFKTKPGKPHQEALMRQDFAQWMAIHHDLKGARKVAAPLCARHSDSDAVLWKKQICT